MTNKAKSSTRERQQSFLLITCAILILSTLVGCGPSAADLEAVDYTPLVTDDWKVSTPAEQGLDPMLVAELYLNAAELETLRGLLVIKNGYLIAEGYFNEGAVDKKNQLQSVTKSYTSALVGIALDQGCLSSVDQKMIEFFPEFTGQITDPRKAQITIRDLICPSSSISHSPAIREPSSITAACRPIGWGSLWHGRVIQISSHSLRSIFSRRLVRRWATIGYGIGTGIISA
jgi:hypothetical protein